MATGKNVIHTGVDFSIYHEVDKTANIPVVVKRQSKSEQSPALTFELKNEWELTHELSIPGIRKATKFDSSQGQSRLFLEYVDGQSLREFLANREWNFDELLNLSIKMAKTLGSLHSVGIIHKDINSRNILIHSGTLDPVFIDFGIATRLNLKSDFSINPNKLEGSLSYISPEQTGRMNRLVDYRSDLYSLGVTMYEMFTRALPFQVSGASELVYAHIAKNPHPPIEVNPNIPKVISDIILKLLEKNSEQRYQSALGLKHDLEEVKKRLDQNEGFESFELASRDYNNRFQIPQKLYGREAEANQLLDLFEEATKGNVVSTFITGFSGVGKSSLVHEIYRPITEHRGIFIEGKFEQYQRNIPYQAITFALRNLIQLLLGESEEKLARWKRLILEHCGSNAGVITALVPEFEVIIGKQKRPPALGPVESQNRFNFTLIQLFKGIAAREHPLVLFLDDLQSADHASIQLMKTLLTDQSISYLFFIGSYRDNEVDLQHPLQRALDDLEQQFGSVNFTKLYGLNEGSVNLMISETLGVQKDECLALSTVIRKKTDSNPYFMQEFLKSLYENELVYWDEKLAHWKWKEAEIAKSAATENVVQFLSRRIGSFPTEVLELMKVASCLGNTFSLSTLQYVTNLSISILQDRLELMVGQGYLLPLGSSEIFVEDDQVFSAFGSYKFVHDRFQQALYSLLEESERNALHLKIGRVLQSLRESGSEHIKGFDVVNHFNEAIDLLTEKDEKKFLRDLNYKSGILAKESSAWNAANKHFRVAKSLLPTNHWETEYQFTFDLFLELAQSEFLNDEVEQSEVLMDALLSKTKSNYEKALVLSQQIVLKGVQGHYEEGIDLSRQCLALLNVKMPKTKTGIRLGILNGLIKAGLRLRKKDSEYILSLPENKSKEGGLVLKVISDTTFSAFFVNREYYLLLQLVATNYSLKYGHTENSGFPFANYGIIQIALFRKYKYGYELGNIALKLNDQFPNQLVRGRILSPITSGILHWNIPLGDLKPYYDEGIAASMQSGDQWYASSAQLNYFALQLRQGKRLNLIQKELVEFHNYFEKQDNIFHQAEYGLYKLFINLLINPEVDEKEISPFVNSFERENKQNEFLLGYLYIFLVRYYVIFRAPEKALEYTRKLKRVFAQIAVSPWEADGNFYMALAVADNDSIEPSKRILKIKKTLKFFESFERTCPENSSCFALLLNAEIKRLENNLSVALESYVKASAQAKESLLIHLEALANERAGELCIRNGFKFEGQKYLHRAFSLYTNWGATQKLEDLKIRYPEIVAVEPAQRSNQKIDLQSTASSSELYFNENLDLNTIMKASTALAEEVKFDGLLDILIKITMENAGAQRVILVLDKDKESMSSISSAKVESDIRFFIGIPKEENDQLPVSLIQYVSRTNEELVLDDATVDFRFAQDLYFQKQLPYSILCVPIHYQGSPIGVIYLENSLTSGVFSEQRLNLIKLLSGQIAISIENALLYENLEEKVQERTQELTEEKKKSDDLLLNILPEDVAEELKETGESDAKQFENVSVLFTDFKSFIQTAEKFSATGLVTELNICFMAFDEIVTKYSLEKIKTIGDAYMAAGGLQKQSQFNPSDLILAGLEMQTFMLKRKADREAKNLPAFEMRVGIHSGPVVAGIVGVKKFQYDIWGDTVNTASRMESSGEVGKVNISQVTYDLVKANPKFSFEHRGEQDVKGKGMMHMWFVELA